MSNLQEYLAQKRDVLAQRKLHIEAGALGASKLKAKVSAEGRSGVRRKGGRSGWNSRAKIMPPEYCHSCNGEGVCAEAWCGKQDRTIKSAAADNFEMYFSNHTLRHKGTDRFSFP